MIFWQFQKLTLQLKIIPHYNIYDTKHLSGKAHRGSAIIIKNNIKYYLYANTPLDYLQATTITLETITEETNIGYIFTAET